MLVAEHDELLELARLAMQTVEPPDHHAVARPELDVAEQALVFRPGLLGVEGADVIVNIDLSDAPSAPLRLLQTIRLLALDTQALP